MFYILTGTSVTYTIESGKSSYLGLLDPSLPSVYIKCSDNITESCTELNNEELEVQYINCATGKP